MPGFLAEVHFIVKTLEFGAFVLFVFLSFHNINETSPCYLRFALWKYFKNKPLPLDLHCHHSRLNQHHPNLNSCNDLSISSPLPLLTSSRTFCYRAWNMSISNHQSDYDAPSLSLLPTVFRIKFKIQNSTWSDVAPFGEVQPHLPLLCSSTPLHFSFPNRFDSFYLGLPTVCCLSPHGSCTPLPGQLLVTWSLSEHHLPHDPPCSRLH